MPAISSRTRRAAVAIGAGALAVVPLAVTASSYVVRPGDSLSEIAVRHATTVEALARANNLASLDAVRAGQMLQIPDATLALPSYVTASLDVEEHTIAPGEQFLQVARHYGVDPTALARTNGIGVNAPMGEGAILHVPGRLGRVNALLTQVGAEVGVNSGLLHAVAWMESAWQQDVISPTGAVGLMQLEPYTGEWVSKFLANQRLDIHVARDNVRVGALLLHHLGSVHSDDRSAALAAYYQGDASIAQNGLYDDTSRYVRVVTELIADAA